MIYTFKVRFQPSETELNLFGQQGYAIVGVSKNTVYLQRAEDRAANVIHQDDRYQTVVSIDPAPEDPDAWPKDLPYFTFNVDDRVINGDGNTGKITEILKGYYDRGHTWRDNPLYYVKTDIDLPGSPIVWWPGWKLTLREGGF